MGSSGAVAIGMALNMATVNSGAVNGQLHPYLSPACLGSSAGLESDSLSSRSLPPSRVILLYTVALTHSGIGRALFGPGWPPTRVDKVMGQWVISARDMMECSSSLRG